MPFDSPREWGDCGAGVLWVLQEHVPSVTFPDVLLVFPLLSWELLPLTTPASLAPGPATLQKTHLWAARTSSGWWALLQVNNMQVQRAWLQSLPGAPVNFAPSLCSTMSSCCSEEVVYWFIPACCTEIKKCFTFFFFILCCNSVLSNYFLLLSIAYIGGKRYVPWTKGVSFN